MMGAGPNECETSVTIFHYSNGRPAKSLNLLYIKHVYIFTVGMNAAIYENSTFCFLTEK